jgi:thiol-disulfide isomerase/thioredoxin
LLRRLPVLLGLLALLASSAVPAREALMRAWPASQARPTLQLTDLDGRQWQLADLRGKVVLLNFWASWCEPCVEELPFLGELAASEPQRLAVLGVNFKESAEQIRRFPPAGKLAYPILLDRSGESFKMWAGGILPTTVLIDRKGKARWRAVGALDASDQKFRRTLEQLLKE